MWAIPQVVDFRRPNVNKRVAIPTIVRHIVSIVRLFAWEGGSMLKGGWEDQKTRGGARGVGATETRCNGEKLEKKGKREGAEKVWR